MEEILQVVVLSRACRNTANIKNRQPIGNMYVKAENKNMEDFYKEIIADELNVKNVEFTDDVRNFTSYSFKPQLKTVGPKFGKYLNLIREKLSSLDGNVAMDELNETGELKLDVGETIALTKEDLLIDSAQMPGYVSDSDYGVTVVLDTNLTEELIEEGMTREIISKIQTMRKDAGFDVTDTINVYEKDNDKIKEVMEKNAQTIKEDVLGMNIIFGETKGFEKKWNINGEEATLAVEKL